MITAACAGSERFATLVKRIDQYVEQKRGSRDDARHTLAQVRAGWCERCPMFIDCRAWASTEPAFAGVAGGVYWHNTREAGIREYPMSMVRPKAQAAS